MKLEELIEDLDPELKGIAFKIKGQYPALDTDDLMQEMYLYLWKKLSNTEIKHSTRSYILQGCWFHLKNYIRTSNHKPAPVSLDKPLGEGQTPLVDMLADNDTSHARIDFDMAVSEVMNNGLSKREKQVFSLTLKGYTLREIGEKLKLSHVMVFKIKKSIKKKAHKHFF